ncbi:hypothetical protein [Xanthobacter versatilis]|uniref:hypothetical protein n=1 Tax=Xanthobacter autotrophicus (strain ATCC BAA-1158 / Py2) TaxID=78245 RepID=UPI003726A1B7
MTNTTVSRLGQTVRVAARCSIAPILRAAGFAFTIKRHLSGHYEEAQGTLVGSPRRNDAAIMAGIAALEAANASYPTTLLTPCTMLAAALEAPMGELIAAKSMDLETLAHAVALKEIAAEYTAGLRVICTEDRPPTKTMVALSEAAQHEANTTAAERLQGLLDGHEQKEARDHLSFHSRARGAYDHCPC